PTPLLSPSFWLTLLLSLPVIGPLLQPGYMWGAHDARSAVYFLFQFDKGIRDGIWYPRWAPDFAFGYGYPMFNIYPPLSSYAGELFVWLGFGYTDAVKIVFGLSAILSGLTMYLFARRLMGPAAGLIAALLYVYLPYHLFDLYVRAALAESVAFVFMPLVMWAFYAAVTRPTLKGILLGALAYAALLFTHSALGILFTLVMGAFVIWQLSAFGFQLSAFSRQRSTVSDQPSTSRYSRFTLHSSLFIAPAAVLGLGLGPSAVFLLPALTEQRFVRLDQWQGGRYAFGKDFVEFFQLFSPHWGFGPSIAGPNDDAGFQIGLAAFVLFLISFLLVPRLQNKALKLTLRFYQFLTPLILFLMLPLSGVIWQKLAFLQAIQFPWRLMFLAAPGLALTGAVIGRMKDEGGRMKGASSAFRLPPSAFILPLLILLSGFPYLQAELRAPKPTEGPVDQAGMFRFQQSSDELTGSTAWVKELPRWSSLADAVIAGGKIKSRVAQSEVWDEAHQTPLLGVDSFEIDSVHEFVWVYAADDQQSVTFYIPYYPGWTATLYEDAAPDRQDLYPDGRIGKAITTLPIHPTDPQGWMRVSVPAGKHFLELRFKDTPVRAAGKWISLFSLIFVGVGLLLLQLKPAILKRKLKYRNSNHE
ncbi:MAG TPA: hypothetical protein ENK24_03135, partial [Anaerolineae bacterium]|nr:hypothetical protein [Anaerolineae bacterium]